MTTRSKILRTLVVLGVLACIAGAGVFSAFSSQTDNPGNSVTVVLTDNDAGAATYANGVADFPGSTTKWATNDSVVYRVTATLAANAPDSAQGQSTGEHILRWEAQNQ